MKKNFKCIFILVLFSSGFFVVGWMFHASVSTQKKSEYILSDEEKLYLQQLFEMQHTVVENDSCFGIGA